MGSPLKRNLIKLEAINNEKWNKFVLLQGVNLKHF